MNEQTPQPQSFLSAPPEGGNRTLLLIVSFIIPIAGVILGIMFMTRADEASQKFGRQALIASLSCMGLFCLFFVCYFVFIMSFSFAPLFFLPTDSGSLLPFLFSAA
ncbi:MAG: hypothetical protein KPEEDBHJ_03004 [Anaerolineales bacterium]|nr:hypothetical protein [Anaerolineales bacterium]